MDAISVKIDRILLRDLGLSPDRAGKIGAAVEMELQHLLDQEGLPDNLAEREILSVSVPEIDLFGPEREVLLPRLLAQAIFRVLGEDG
jgi:hypothetical protein